MTANLARALAAQGRDDEAAELATRAGELAVRDDLYSQVERRGPLALVLARQGRTAEAERLAAEAVEIAAPTDMLTMRGDALLDQAAVAAAAGRPGDAARIARDALALYRAKGNLAGAARAEVAAYATA
jgi:tetratricopeptide (TPR) repeat protein